MLTSQEWHFVNKLLEKLQTPLVKIHFRSCALDYWDHEMTKSTYPADSENLTNECGLEARNWQEVFLPLHIFNNPGSPTKFNLMVNDIYLGQIWSNEDILESKAKWVRVLQHQPGNMWQLAKLTRKKSMRRKIWWHYCTWCRRFYPTKCTECNHRYVGTEPNTCNVCELFVHAGHASNNDVSCVFLQDTKKLEIAQIEL